MTLSVELDNKFPYAILHLVKPLGVRKDAPDFFIQQIQIPDAVFEDRDTSLC